MGDAEQLAAVPWLAGLPDGVRAGLAAQAERVVWPAGHVVCRQDEEDRRCFVLTGGRLRVSRVLPDGRGVTVAVLEPGAAFGEMALLGAGRRTATVRAEVDSSGLALADADVLPVLRAHPDAALAVALELAGRVTRVEERVLRYALGTAAGGVSATLLAWVEARQARGGPERDVELAGTAGDVARDSGLPRRAVQRFLTHLELEGVVSARRGRLVVHDPAALATYLR